MTRFVEVKLNTTIASMIKSACRTRVRTSSVATPIRGRGHPADLEIITETPAHLRKFHDPESGLALMAGCLAWAVGQLGLVAGHGHPQTTGNRLERRRGWMVRSERENTCVRSVAEAGPPFRTPAGRADF
ncbi:hypothetical protein [Bradyrhizobium sp. SZCCHNR2028]|uniref:hypothetical protein n=1 Tax=Bradyrhizobium sp. SZCCHNR2028 TaxID=3057382 RepID=UPI0028E4E675|nr:hypothetical protein [Bradyrhizobium sp. SZCCHNR2028]